MDIRYIGPHDRQFVPLPTGGGLEVDRGDVLTVPDDLGERLLDQPSNWSAVLDVGDATNDELRVELAKHEIVAPARATKAELVALLEAATAGASLGEAFEDGIAGASGESQDNAGGDPPGDQAGNGETN